MIIKGKVMSFCVSVKSQIDSVTNCPFHLQWIHRRADGSSNLFERWNDLFGHILCYVWPWEDF